MYGTCPEALVGHSTTLVGCELFIWGGGDGKAVRHDLHVVDTIHKTWSAPVAAGQPPNARLGHSAVAERSKLSRGQSAFSSISAKSHGSKP